MANYSLGSIFNIWTKANRFSWFCSAFGSIRNVAGVLSLYARKTNNRELHQSSCDLQTFTENERNIRKRTWWGETLWNLLWQLLTQERFWRNCLFYVIWKYKTYQECSRQGNVETVLLLKNFPRKKNYCIIKG